MDPCAVKHTVPDQDAAEHTHPTYFPLTEQWEAYTQQIQTLKTGQAFLRLPDDTVRRVQTPRLPDVSVPDEQLTEVQEYYYLHRHFWPLPAPDSLQEPPASLPVRPRPCTSRNGAR